MKRVFLERCLAEGLSLSAMAELVSRHPSTVSYWLNKYGLSASRKEVNAPKGGLERAELEALLEAKLTLNQIAIQLQRSVTTVRYWIDKYGLKANNQGRLQAQGEGPRPSLECRRHGTTKFVLEGRGYYRCGKCRAEAVAKRRRVIKQKLVEEAGGKCFLCGYSRCRQGLHFHHVDPATKEFHLGRPNPEL